VVQGEDIKAMVDMLGHDLRGLRDQAILLLGSAGGLRRSEIVGLDIVRDDHSDGYGWIEIFPGHGVLMTLRGKTAWREVEVGRGAADQTCPVAALQSWIRFGRIARGPLFCRIFEESKTVDGILVRDRGALSATARPLPRQSHQGVWPLIATICVVIRSLLIKLSGNPCRHLYSAVTWSFFGSVSSNRSCCGPSRMTASIYSQDMI